MKKIKEYVNVLLYPILLILIEFSLIFVFTIIFSLNTNLEVGTVLYQEKLNLFLSNYKLLIVIITSFILLPLILKKVKISIKNITKNNLIIYIMIGICIGLSYNLLLCCINKMVYFTNLYDYVNKNILITLLTTGILGPILEEFVFRGVVYEKLKKFNKKSTSLLITGMLFGLFHGNIIQFVYAFLLNFILIKSYEKEKSILAPILIHVSANSVTTLLLNFIIQINIFSTIILFLIFLIVLIVLLKNVYKENNNGYDNSVNECWR